MNFKKFISGVSALTIAASAFAGMAVTANAYTTTASSIENGHPKIVEDFETSTPFSITATDDRNKRVTDDFSGSTVGGVINSRAIYWNMPNSYTGDTYFSADVKIDATNSGGKVEDFILCSTASKKDNYAGTNRTGDILVLEGTTSGTNSRFSTITINGIDITSLVLSSSGCSQNGMSSGYVDRDTTGWLTISATVDFDNKTLDINVKKAGSTVYSNAALPFSDNTSTSLQAIVLANGGQSNGCWIDNIVVEDAPVASIAISGSDEVRAGTSSSYTASVADQYGDAITPSKTATLALQNAVDGVTLESGVLSADASVAAGTEVVLTATADGLAAVTKTVTIAADKGYILTTTPYALVSVDGGAAINSGFDGVVDFATSDYTGANHTVVISKPGYTTRTESLTLALNETGTYKLDCSVGSYYEDFSQINDNMNQTDVAIGNGSFHYEGGSNTSATVTLPETVNADGSVITIAVASDHSRNGYLYLGDALGLYLRVGGIREASQDVDSARVESGYDIVKMYLPNTDDSNHRPVLYVNGIKNSATLARKDDNKKIFNSITVRNAGNTPRMSIDYILVEPLGAAADTEPTSTVTIVDGDSSTATSYYKGTSFTLPAAAGKDGYTFEGWSDGTNTYAAGTALTADATKTYTAVYTQNIPDAPTSTFVAANWTSDVPTWTADGNKLTDTFGASVYGYKTDITGYDGYTYTVKGYIKSSESDGSTTLTLGTITDASPMVFYLVTDEALDLNASNVYCE